MIRTFLATTAMATLLATGAMAQTTTGGAAGGAAGAGTTAQQPAQPMVKKAEGQLASNVIGKSVYNGTGDDAENIGEVNDLVIDKDGKIQAIVVGVGGFLGIGQKSVALEYGLVEWQKKGDEEWLVVQTTADALKAQPEFDPAAYEPMPADADVSETKPATKEDLDNAPTPDEGGDAATGGADTGAATGGAAGGAATGGAATDSGAATGGSDTGAATDGSSDSGAATDTGSDTGAASDTSGDSSATSGSSDDSSATSGSDDSSATSGSDDSSATSGTDDSSATSGSSDDSSMQSEDSSASSGSDDTMKPDEGAAGDESAPADDTTKQE